MRLFHGTDCIVTKPEIRFVGYTKDFGYGFYCTHLERQAKRWAVAKFKHPTHQIIFCNDKALSTLKYIEHYEIDK